MSMSYLFCENLMEILNIFFSCNLRTCAIHQAFFLVCLINKKVGSLVLLSDHPSEFTQLTDRIVIYEDGCGP
jgi:hypothetical protein